MEPVSTAAQDILCAPTYFFILHAPTMKLNVRTIPINYIQDAIYIADANIV